MDAVRGLAEKVVGNVEKVIVGKTDAVRLTVVGLLCQGHLLIEDVPGTGKINLPVIAPSAFYKSEALEPKALPACFIIGDSSEHDLQAQNFAMQNHTVFVAILSEDKENDQLQRKTWRYAEALYRALHDVALQGNMRVLVELVSYSPTYGNSGDRENRQFRKDCTVRLKIKHFDRFT